MWEPGSWCSPDTIPASTLNLDLPASVTVRNNTTVTQSVLFCYSNPNRLAAAAAKSLQSCLTLCDPIDGSPPGSPVSGILQARTLEWAAISFSNAWKWKVKVKSFSRVLLLATHGLQPTRLLRPWDLPGKSTRVGCHCLLQFELLISSKISCQTRRKNKTIVVRFLRFLRIIGNSHARQFLPSSTNL